MIKLLRHQAVFLIIAAVMLLMLSFILYVRDSSVRLSQSRADIGNGASVVIATDGTIREFQGPVSEKMNLLQALYTAGQAASLPLIYSIDTKGLVNISGLDGYINGTDNKYWNIYYNGSHVDSTMLNAIEIHNGDTMEAKFEMP